MCVRNSGRRNGCANFTDAWKNAFFLQEKNMSTMNHEIPRFGGGILGFGEGGSADFIFMGARIFLKTFLKNIVTSSSTNFFGFMAHTPHRALEWY